LTERGVAVTIASRDGGKVEMDSLSDPREESKWSAEDLITMGFVNTPELMELLQDTPKLSDLDPDEFDAIMVAGGQSPMFTFRDNEDLKLTILLRVREADRDLLPWNRRAVWSERAALSRAEDGRTRQRDAGVRGAP